ncbi:MAG TPA: nucleotidyltransferase domain-containing protein [Phycisphaerae bacterium]|nr:nucleotidyltransferase domain-containing protein [Phycisphaerae bacterium]
MNGTRSNPPPILPVGTQIVTRVEIAASAGQPGQPRGAVGIVLRSPADSTHAYRVRFVNGGEATLHRKDFSVRKQHQEEGLRRGPDDGNDQDLTQFVIYRCISGSRAYGLDNEESDTDRRGIYLPPAERHWSLYGVPEQLENTETEECYWELGKFLILALKANPNVLECLYTPMVELATPLARELLDMKAAFLSRLVYQTYNGYVMSQFRKLEQDLRNKGAIKWKHAMHLIRLLLSGITVLREGFVPVRVDEYRDRLLAIRDGRTPWEEINAWRLDLHQRFDDAFTDTRLPEQPDYHKIDAFLIKARRSMVPS